MDVVTDLGMISTSMQLADTLLVFIVESASKPRVFLIVGLRRDETLTIPCLYV